MGERNFYLRYRASRTYADEQATLLKAGEEVGGWAYETDRLPGMPAPPTVTMTGAAWVGHVYAIAAEDAEILASHSRAWRDVAEECKGLAQRFQGEAKETEMKR